MTDVNKKYGAPDWPESYNEPDTLPNAAYRHLAEYIILNLFQDFGNGEKTDRIMQHLNRFCNFKSPQTDNIKRLSVLTWIESLDTKDTRINFDYVNDLFTHMIKDEIVVQFKPVEIVNHEEIRKTQEEKEDYERYKKSVEIAEQNAEYGYKPLDQIAESTIIQRKKETINLSVRKILENFKRLQNIIASEKSEPIIEVEIIYNEIITRILERMTKLQEQSKIGSLVPEFGGLIEAINIIQSVREEKLALTSIESLGE